MPCPHFDVKVIQRSKRQSAVASAAYQSGERLFSEYDQKQKYYSHKSEIVHTEIILPPHAPPEYADRNTLWNAAEAIEKQWNSQLARRFVLAIPRELPRSQYADLIRDYCREFFVSKGMIADFAIHDKGDGNPHAHILLTMRAMDETGKWLPKSRKVYDIDGNGERIRLASGRWKSHKEDTVDWNDQKYAEIWRQGWADTANRYLEAIGRPERLDLRSYARHLTDSWQKWTAFLTTASRLYKYSFHEQLMIFAQRPDATACAEYNLWNDTMRRYVRRGSKGIALVDNSREKPRLRYVFDISDTGLRKNSRHPFLWELRPEHETAVAQALTERFGAPPENNLAEQLESIAAQLVSEYWVEHKRDILDIVDGSFLEGYDEFNIGVQFRNAATVSITYSLLSRCGLEPEGYFDHEDFLSIWTLYSQNYYRIVKEKNRTYYEVYSLPRTETPPEGYTQVSFVCLRPDGAYEAPATVSSVCRYSRKKIGDMDDFHFHLLRHTYTTNLLSHGAAPKDVQELLGHSDVSTTMNIYAHATREAKRTSARLLDKVVGTA